MYRLDIEFQNILHVPEKSYKLMVSFTVFSSLRPGIKWQSNICGLICPNILSIDFMSKMSCLHDSHSMCRPHSKQSPSRPKNHKRRDSVGNTHSCFNDTVMLKSPWFYNSSLCLNFLKFQSI